jgi:hypothetical protein
MTEGSKLITPVYCMISVGEEIYLRYKAYTYLDHMAFLPSASQLFFIYYATSNLLLSLKW